MSAGRTPEEREAARREREGRRRRRDGEEEAPPGAPGADAGAAPDGAGPGDEAAPDGAEPAAAEPLGPEAPGESPPAPAADLGWADGDWEDGGWAQEPGWDEDPDAPDPDEPGDPHEPDDGPAPRAPTAVAVPAATAPVAPAPAPRRRRRRRLGARLLVLVLIVLLAGVGYFAYVLFEPGKGDGTGQVAVHIPTGAGAREIGDLLARKDVVSSGFLFSLRATLGGQRGALRSGKFTLRHDMSYGAALTALTTPPKAAKVVEVALPEGKSIKENAPTVKARGLHGSYVTAAHHTPPAKLRAPAGTHTLEGLLFPATYQLRRHASAAALVAKQRATFDQNLAKVPLAYARAKHLTPYDVVVIASLIERETGTASDRPKIAAVIYNRLRRSMPLGIDSSLRYALDDWTHPITQSELASSSPYNLSKRLGLPPTPIGNPGLASLRAAAHPAHVGYLYFVARPGTCGSVFTTSYSAFLAASAKYQKAQRSGKKITTCAGK